MKLRTLIAAGGAATLLATAAGLTTRAHAQDLLLDKPVRAGELVVFPTQSDENAYYYVNDKPKLALDANGQPQFSFLRYVENVRSGADQPEAREGEGGGIVHAVVTLSVSPEQLSTAQQELERVKPGAKLVGPVIYKSGKFGLVSTFKDTQGNLTKQVVGLGNAPLLDGEKAAVSMQLTKLGAKILWESFQTPTPDISFSFEMELTGYRSPHRAVIEANFDQIYQHQAFGAALASTYLAAEIKTAYDDLQRSGAIKLTEVGSDEKLDALITTAYNKLADMMFSPLAGSGTPDLSSLNGAAGQPGLLDRATNMLAKNRAEAKADNDKIHAENDKARADKRADERAAAAANREKQPDATVANATGDGEAPSTETEDPDDEEWGSALAPGADPGTKTGRAGRVGSEDKPAAEKAEVPVPEFAVIASFEMKKVHQQGVFKIDLNKYTTDNLTLRFDENIGDLHRMTSDAAHFRQVNLDDPLYRQRELAVFVDGMNAKDFGDYINFATVQMRKKHEGGGEDAQDEVRIDRTNFNKDGNNFKLMYGWNNDANRAKWMDYEYQTTWSFFGGKQMQQPWRHASAGAIALAPPFQRCSVDLQADPDEMTKAQVRTVTVKIYYTLADAEQVKQTTLNAAKGQLSDRIDFILPAGKFDYDYEITWQLKGNKTVTSGRKHANGAVLFVDEIPGG